MTAMEQSERDWLATKAALIRQLARVTASNIVEIGQHLIDVKERVGQGNFIEWIKGEFEWARTTAWRFMEVAEKMPRSNLEHLDIDVSALYLIAAPSTPAPVREEAIRRATSGEHVTHAVVKAVVVQTRATPAANSASVRDMFDAVRAVRAEARRLLPSPADARRSAIETGAHTLDYTGTYQPPVTKEEQQRWQADIHELRVLFDFLDWKPKATAQQLAQTIIERGWRDDCERLEEHLVFLARLREALQ